MIMINDYTEIFYGGLSIITGATEENKYHIRIKSPNEIWCGSPGDLEAVCESHDLLIESLILMTGLLEDVYGSEEVHPGIKKAKEALRRANVI